MAGASCRPILITARNGRSGKEALLHSRGLRSRTEGIPEVTRSPLAGLLSRLMLSSLLWLPIAASGNSDTRVELDRSLNEAKNALLEKEAGLRQQETALRYPPHARTSIYVDKRSGGFILESLEVRIDGRTVASQDYSLTEARALADGAMQRILRIALPRGDHEISVRYNARALRGGDGEPVSGELQGRFEKGAEALDVIVPVAINPQPIQYRQIAPDARGNTSGNQGIERVVAGSEKDPRLGHARFLNGTGSNFGALVELRQVDSGSGDAALPESFDWLLARSYLNFGMHDEARRAYRRLGQRTADRERLNAALLDLAEFEYERGYVFEAVERLRDLRNQIAPDQMTRWQDITSRVLLAQGRYGEAADVLRERADRSDHSVFMRYNLGVALLNDGQLNEGRSTLDAISRTRINDDAERALRDRANTVLGYHFLRAEQGGTARPLFSRVRTEGPFSNRALLGMGWAELAPRGNRQDRQTLVEDEDSEGFRDVASLGVLIRPGFFEADIYERLANRPFRRDNLGESEEESLLRALVVWNELVKRDPMDAAVQEGMLAIPYALDRLGDYEQAMQRYQKAIDVFEEARERIDQGIRSVEGALMLNTIVRRDASAQSGYNWRLLDLPDLPETYWLNRLLAEHRFQEQLKNFRDARLLAQRVEAIRNQVDDIFMAASALPAPPDSEILSGGYSMLDRRDLPALRLRSDMRLRMRDARDPAEAAPVHIPLRAAAPPLRFDGRREAYARAASDLAPAQQRLERIAREQSEAVRAMAIKELEEQREVLERYLLEARFAVARLYDRRLRDDRNPNP